MLVLTAALTLAAGLPPNFILLMSDDTGWGDVSYNNVSSRIHSEYLRVHVDFPASATTSMPAVLTVTRYADRPWRWRRDVRGEPAPHAGAG